MKIVLILCYLVGYCTVLFGQNIPCSNKTKTINCPQLTIYHEHFYKIIFQFYENKQQSWLISGCYLANDALELPFFCNSFNNSTAYDIVLDNALSNSALVPSQGSTSKAAGNKFNGSVMDIQYPANVTRLRYYYNQNNFREFPDNVINTNRIITRANTCPDLTISQLTAGTQMFNTAQQQYTQ